jgi:hypothetical protein
LLAQELTQAPVNVASPVIENYHVNYRTKFDPLVQGSFATREYSMVGGNVSSFSAKSKTEIDEKSFFKVSPDKDSINENWFKY